MKPLPVTLIVLTYNEELNLAHCLENAARRVAQVIVVDSGSTDATLAIAKRFGAEIYRHPFRTQAEQFNWALAHADPREEWILRLDADETVSEGLWEEMGRALREAPADLAAFYLKRRVYFMGRWIRHGGYYPTWLLRLFRKGRAQSEERAMDEHLVLVSGGRTAFLQHDFTDENRKGLAWWVKKHRAYAEREAEAMLAARRAKAKEVSPRFFGSQPERRRWIKERIYWRLPPFVRPFLYFFYRYVLRFGFLDGYEGLIFHFLQGLWYRLLVDARYVEFGRQPARRRMPHPS